MKGSELQIRENGQSVHSDAVVKEIDSKSIKLLAAGEKINDIETAIRELIENSIDAEAKNIEIRLARFGIDSIEVEDNGVGIEESDFKSLGMRYHTSKIRSYTKLQEALETFGFRGEALSCLCNIATVTITTKSKSSPNGWKLVFEKDGTLSRTEPIGRDNGTTVILKNIFHSFPVRRKELEKSAKKQYDKIVRLVYEQALARPYIKFTLCKKTGARKDKDFTHGGTTLDGCLTTIFGIKLLENLMPIKQFIEGQLVSISQLPEEETNQKLVSKSEHDGTKIEKMKKISLSCKTGDQQVEDETLTEQFNDATCTSDTFSAYCKEDTETRTTLGTALSTNSEIITSIDTSKAIISQPKDEFFKRSCRSKFARRKPEYTIHGYISKIGCGRNSSDGQFIFVNSKPCEVQKLTRTVNEIYRNYCNQYPFFCIFIQVQAWAADFNVPRKRSVILQDNDKLCDIVRESLEAMYSSYIPATQKSCLIAQIPFAMPLKQSDITKKPSLVNKRSHSPDNSDAQKSIKKTMQEPAGTKFQYAIELLGTTPEKMPQDNLDHVTGVNNSEVLSHNTREQVPPENLGLVSKDTVLEFVSGKAVQKVPEETSGVISKMIVSEIMSKKKTDKATRKSPDKKDTRVRQTPADLSPYESCKFHQINAKVNDTLQASLQFSEDLGLALERDRTQRDMSPDDKQFSFAIHPKFNAPAEEELKLYLNKTSFKEMQVLGQFNKGFIITRLNKHLFIIDQHATDERANYEEQLENSPLVRQPMVLPKPLYLNLIQENAILNNMVSFQKRGFEFVIDKSKTIGYRVMLSSTSICKGPTKDEYLGKEDIEELIDVALESPNRLESYVLSKVRTVSASVACRKSVMIGDSLTWQEMTNIVGKMSDLKNPWVCAHNRPTIRHLMDIDWISKK